MSELSARPAKRTIATSSAEVGVNRYKTPNEHNESAFPPKLSVKADIALRQ
jgi:hypothetical protein